MKKHNNMNIIQGSQMKNSKKKPFFSKKETSWVIYRKKLKKKETFWVFYRKNLKTKKKLFG